MNKLRRRYIFDIILSALLIFEMFYELTGDFLHEVMGCIFFVTIILHLILSRKWMSATARQMSTGKQMKLANKLRLTLAIGLAVSFVALMASSIAISLVLIDVTGVNLAGATRETWIVIHTASSYALCAFTIAHVLVHWASVCSAFKIPYNPARRQAINTGASAVVAVSAISLGIVGSKAIDDTVNPKLTQQQGTGIPTAQAAQSTERPGRGDKPAFPKEVPSNNDSSSSTSNGSQPPVSPSANSNGSGSTASNGYCTLCKLRCPLSAPQCDRPRKAGLI